MLSVLDRFAALIDGLCAALMAETRPGLFLRLGMFLGLGQPLMRTCEELRGIGEAMRAAAFAAIEAAARPGPETSPLIAATAAPRREIAREAPGQAPGPSLPRSPIPEAMPPHAQTTMADAPDGAATVGSTNEKMTVGSTNEKMTVGSTDEKMMVGSTDARSGLAAPAEGWTKELAWPNGAFLRRRAARGCGLSILLRNQNKTPRPLARVALAATDAAPSLSSPA